MPGYEDVVDNEMVHQLERTGSEHLFRGTEPACRISIGVAKKAATGWVNRNDKKYWEAII
jgi:hypothetical protein